MLQKKFKMNESEPLDIEAAKFIIEEINSNAFEKRYVTYDFTKEE